MGVPKVIVAPGATSTKAGPGQDTPSQSAVLQVHYSEGSRFYGILFFNVSICIYPCLFFGHLISIYPHLFELLQTREVAT